MNSITENLSDKIAFKLCGSKDKSSDEFEVLRYGVFAFLHICIAAILTILFGILTNTLFQIVTISLVAGLMKRNSGGVHCSSPNRCVLAGIIVAYIFTLIGKNVIYMKHEYVYIVCTIALAHSFIILYKKCPVPCENKPLKKEETRKRLRKNAFSIYSICIILFISNILLSSTYFINNLNSLVLYMILGLYMQALSLTNIGSKSILFIDKVLLKFKI
ncbi:accessory gene regulator B family protein [Terrisporobacter petrolearius]|uniref:accessory gene regulator ArgB-like protein n=1 Tax=Terrisporobacter petrolearius TaxID=1460447 RepID=UPI001D16F860|nr:accessory gene regulator B family protein [Terrisporobacter petrolearius]MCC3865619.1 accessory gene regulator B family protein [Terrisporobacter petrolearius]